MRRRRTFGSGATKSVKPPKEEKLPLPKRIRLIDAFKGYISASVHTRVAALSDALKWWDEAIPILMKRKPLTPDEIKSFSIANKARALAVGSKTEDERETALIHTLKKFEKIWAEPNNIPQVNAYYKKYLSVKDKLEQKDKLVKEKYQYLLDALNEAYKPIGLSFAMQRSEKDRVYDGDKTIMLSTRLLRALSDKAKHEGMLPVLLSEAFTVAKSSGIERDAENKHVPNLQKMLVNVPAVLEAALTYCASLPRGKVFKSFTSKLEASSANIPERPKKQRDPNAPRTTRTPRPAGSGVKRVTDPAQLVAGRYNPGSTLAKLYERLADQKPHPLSELFKDLGVGNPMDRLKWVIKHGNRSGKWTIAIHNNVAQMTVN